MAAGDRRGELIHIQVALEDAPKDRQAALRARERALFKELSVELGLEALGGAEAEWRRGHVASVRSPNLRAMRSLFAHPAGRFVETLILDNPNLEMSDQVDLLGVLRPPHVTKVVVRTNDGAHRYDAGLSLGALLSLPALRSLKADAGRLDLRGTGNSGVIDLEAAALGFPLQVLAGWAFPRLETLTLGARSAAVYLAPNVNMGAGVNYVREVPFDPILRARLQVPPRFSDRDWAPKLRALNFRSFIVLSEDTPGLFEVARRGAQLDLSECAVSERAYEELEPLQRTQPLNLPATPSAELED